MRTRKVKILKVDENINQQTFKKMVEDHDPTYLWSKNQNHIEIEKNKEEEILKARNILGDEICVPIWNGLMRKKVVPSFVHEYIWEKSKHELKIN